MSHAFGTAIYNGRVKLPGGTQQEANQVQHADCALEAMIQTVNVGPTRQTHFLGYDHKMTLHPTVVRRCTETSCSSILINKDEVPDLSFSQRCYWVCKYCAL